MTLLQNIVWIHGGLVEGSGLQGVHDLLTANGFDVTGVRVPTQSPEDSAAFCSSTVPRSRIRSPRICGRRRPPPWGALTCDGAAA